eukprot:42153-Lingulodinium_polyedra.AAC.1
MSHAHIGVKLARPHIWHSPSVTAASFTQNAFAMSTKPVRGVLQWSTAACGSKSSKSGSIRNKGILFAGRNKLISCVGPFANAA